MFVLISPTDHCFFYHFAFIASRCNSIGVNGSLNLLFLDLGTRSSSGISFSLICDGCLEIIAEESRLEPKIKEPI